MTRLRHWLRAWGMAVVGIGALSVAAAAQARLPGSFANLRVVGRLVTFAVESGRPVLSLNEAAGQGLVWLSDSSFATGTLEVTVRGQDVVGRSFVGIAFAGRNDSTYEAVYLRPFNFNRADSTRHAHAIQYIAQPAYPWERLRAERTGVFEQPLRRRADPNAWTLLRLVITADSVFGFVNGGAAPDLAVARLAPGAVGRTGYWVGDGSGGTFRGLIGSTP